MSKAILLEGYLLEIISSSPNSYSFWIQTRPISIAEWVDYFLGDMEGPSNFYASVEDPLLQELKFRVSSQNAQSPMSIYFSDKVMQFKSECTRVRLLAVFISIWLCSYCVPIGEGAYIRPEVFMAAASILHKGHDGASELLPWLMYTTVWTIFAITLLSTMFQPASVNYNYRHIS